MNFPYRFHFPGLHCWRDERGAQTQVQRRAPHQVQLWLQGLSAGRGQICLTYKQQSTRASGGVISHYFFSIFPGCLIGSLHCFKRRLIADHLTLIIPATFCFYPVSGVSTPLVSIDRLLWKEIQRINLRLWPYLLANSRLRQRPLPGLPQRAQFGTEHPRPKGRAGQTCSTRPRTPQQQQPLQRARPRVQPLLLSPPQRAHQRPHQVWSLTQLFSVSFL